MSAGAGSKARGRAQCASAEPMDAATHALMGRLLEAWSECAHVSAGAGGKARGKAQCASAEPMEAATHALMGRLLEAWSECAPSQLSAAPEAASAACCRAVLVCAIRLLDILPPGAVTILLCDTVLRSPWQMACQSCRSMLEFFRLCCLLLQLLLIIMPAMKMLMHHSPPCSG